MSPYTSLNRSIPYAKPYPATVRVTPSQQPTRVVNLSGGSYRVRLIRRDIANGRYETDQKLDQAIDRIMLDLA
ncbi:MAG: hypothetical protein AAGH88_00170 [Planctomycetota bacterium]